MPWIALAPSITAAVLSRDSTGLLIVGIANVVVSFFAINTILNLGTQLERGEVIELHDSFKNGAVAALTASWIVALVLIALAVV